MPEESNSPPPPSEMDISATLSVPPQSYAEANTVHRTAERLAALEARATVEIASLKNDTQVIRVAVHDFNNKMQMFVAAEQACQAALLSLTTQVGNLTLSLSPMGEAVKEFQRMHNDLVELIKEQGRREGVVGFWRKFAAIVAAGAALVACLSGMAAGLIWLTQHVKA